MSYLQNNYSDNEYYMYNYLNQKIVQSVNNKMMKDAWGKDPTPENIKESLDAIQADITNKTDFASRISPFYINNNITPAAPIITITYNTISNILEPIKTVSVTASLDTLKYIKCGLDRNYRCINYYNTDINDPMDDTSLLITNLSYDVRYITNEISLGSFYPDDVNLHIVAPKVYLELCNTYISDFFTQLFTEIVNNKTITVGKTADSINAFCIPNGTNDKVNDACSLEIFNDRCACYDCFAGHSYENRQIAKTMEDTNVVSLDTWCKYPKCASGKAFKNRIIQNKSICSNISVSGIFLNPSEYSNIEISNTQVAASSSNNNGINIVGGWCKGCKGKCVSNGDKMICVEDDKQDLKNIRSNNGSNNESNIGSNNGSNIEVRWSFILLIIVSSILITMLVFYTIYPSKRNIIKPVLLISIIIFLFSIIFYTINKGKKEEFDPFITPSQCKKDSVCYSDTDCSNNKKCLGNRCQCSYGYFPDNNNCVDFQGGLNTQINKILYTLPYLPNVLFTSIYYYTTVVDGIIYAFSIDANFKYDGEKWCEIARFPNQIGFHPDKPIIPYKDGTTYTLNTNMCYTYLTSVYFLLSNKTLLESVVNDTSTNKYTYMSYDTLTDKWNTYIPTVLPNTIDELKDIDSIYGSTTVIKNGIMYIFDFTQYMITINLSTNIITKGKKNITDISCTSNVYAFLHNDIIYVAGIFVGIKTAPSGYNIYSYNENDESFTLVKTISPTVPVFDVKTNKFGLDIGGKLSFYKDGKIFILYGDDITNKYTCSYYDITKNTTNIGTVTIPVGTSIFSNSLTISQEIPFYQIFSSGNCTFLLLDYVFIVTGSGEIFRGYVDETSDVLNIILSPCYGISNYERPIDQRIM